MIRLPPRSHHTATLFPYTTPFRSQLLRWSKRHGVRIAISGGAEAWKLAPQLAAAGVPVFVDPLANLPSDFDHIGASMENAARLHAAGVAVGFTQSGDASHNARKIRQLAGNAVANGLPWADGLAGLTRVPAQRSEARRVGEECVSTCRSRWSPSHSKKKKK